MKVITQMKTTTRTPRNGSAARAPKQASTPPDSAPAEFKVVRLRECPVASTKMNTPTDVETFWRAHVETAPWFKADKECLVVFLLDTRRNLLGFEMLSQGTKDTVLVNVAEVFRLAAMKSAAAIIVAHNHPSGDPSPSEADIKVTRDMIRGGVLLRIDVLDHVVIGTPLEAGAFCHASLLGLGYFYEPATPADGYSVGTGEQAAAPAVVVDETPVVSYRNLPPLKRESVIHEDGFDMELAVHRAIALMELMARQDCTATERQNDEHSGGGANGMMSWASDLNHVLHRDFYAANHAKFNGGDKITAVRRLVNTIEKFHALLMTFAHDLSSSDYSTGDKLGFEPPEDDIAPFLSLASDCIEYLKACFYDRFGQDLPMDQIDREINEELLAKFPQAQEQRRAA